MVQTIGVRHSGVAIFAKTVDYSGCYIVWVNGLAFIFSLALHFHYLFVSTYAYCGVERIAHGACFVYPIVVEGIEIDISVVYATAPEVGGGVLD